MSEEFNHAGTVRRRPRTGYQRTGVPYEGNQGNGQAHSNGAHKLNGDPGADPAHSNANARSERAEFERDRFYDREPEPEPSQPRRRPRSRREPKHRQALPYYGRELDAEPPLFRFPFDPWRLYGAAKRNLAWILAGGLLLGILGLFVALMAVDYKISLPLIRKTSNAVHTEGAIPDQFSPREYSDATLYAFMKAGAVLRSVAEKAAADPALAGMHVTAEKLAKAVSVNPPPNPDFVILTMENLGDLRAMPALINLYASEVVDYTREVQMRESRVINKYLQEQVAEAEKQIAALTVELGKFSQTGYIGFERETDEDFKELMLKRQQLETAKSRHDLLALQIASLVQAVPNSRLQQARQELQNLLLTRTEIHPDVQLKRQEIAQLEKQQQEPPVAVANGSNPGANPVSLRGAELKVERDSLEKEISSLTNAVARIEARLKGRNSLDVPFELKKAELDSKKKARDVLAEKERQSRLFADNSLGYFSIPEPATAGNINYKGRWLKVGFLSVAAGLLGLLVTLGIVFLTEVLDTSIKTAEDITRITKLPVLATLGDLRKMSAAAQVQWAFRTLTVLKGKLSQNPDQSLVCGIISANHGEGRSTWVNLLVSAASQRGLRVLTVDTRPTSAAPVTGAGASTKSDAKPDAKQETKAEAGPATGPEAAKAGAPHSPINLPDHQDTSLMQSVLSTPAKVAEQLEGPNAQPVVHIPLPGWVWSLERRKQWQKALDYWRDIDNLVIFVELPPACESESVLLAENLPQLIWLVGSGMADAAETRTHLDTLKHAGCNLVGAVLNQAPPPFLNAKISRWFNRTSALVLLGTFLSFTSASAAEQAEATQPELQNAVLRQNQSSGMLSFSANAKRPRAEWQKHLTLGPGDTIDIHFFSNSVYTAQSRTNVFIGPDGRINYLYANGIPAAGLTVEELRGKISQALAPYFVGKPPTIVVVPVSFSSKKYYMLGKVNTKGAFILDRPLTLIEAVARAKGLETGLYQRTTVEMADLGHSFLIRNGEKLSIDFEKLFLDGDLTQNTLIEPNDYIYFASTGANDIYILGEVMTPGPIGFVPNATLLTAITDRGGFTDKAYKRRVLVVRGSLNEPEMFVVDTGGVLDGRLRDFKLQPKDIVYVGHRPWLKAEDLLDEAAGAFIEGAMTTWAGANFGPFITRRLLPKVSVR